MPIIKNNYSKFALVTGTDHGVGYELVKALLPRGYYVVAARMNPEEKQIDALQEAHPDQMAIVQVNIGEDASVARMKEQVFQLVPQLDLLINDAGILGDMNQSVEDELDFDEMLRVINVNALGTLRVTNVLVQLVEKSEEKKIVNISSEAGSIGDCFRESWFGYCMSKAANNMQSNIVYNRLKKKGVTVIAMHPGHVATWMRGHLDTTAKITPDIAAAGVLDVVLDRELPVEDHPLFLDYTGHRRNW